MAEADREEKVFDPTPKRRADFRRDGRAAVSKDVNSAVQLVAMLGLFAAMGEDAVTAMGLAVRHAIERFPEAVATGQGFADATLESLALMGLPVLGLGALVGLSAVLANAVQTKGMFAGKMLGFRWDRVNPLSKIKEIFGPRKLTVRLLLAVAKVGLGGLVITLVFIAALPDILELGRTSIQAAYVVARDAMFEMLAATTVVIGALAILDYLWQRRQMTESMRMTREELKKEHEESEGKPEYKARRIALHRGLSFNQIIQEVPQADVIVTNPTHFAVALRYRAGEDSAPRVTAKGVDEMALHIRAVARRHGVPIVEQRPLARALWRQVKVGQPVPGLLYQQVASVLARVLKARLANQPSLAKRYLGR